MSGGPLPDMSSPVRHVATVLDKAAGSPVSISDMARSYRHPNPADIVRLRRDHGLRNDSEAKRYLISMALGELRGQIIREGEDARLRPGTTIADLEWEGRPVHPTTEGRPRELRPVVIAPDTVTPGSPGWDQLLADLKDANDIPSASQRKWTLGDTLLAAVPEDHSPSVYVNGVLRQIGEALGIPWDTLRNYRHTASCWPPETRIWRCTWTVYQDLQRHQHLIQHDLQSPEARERRRNVTEYSRAPGPPLAQAQWKLEPGSLDERGFALLDAGKRLSEVCKELGLPATATALYKMVGRWEVYRSFVPVDGDEAAS